MASDLAIGPYKVAAAIGTGGFASVFKAFDDRLGADVAIKLLADNHSLDPEVRARFVSEGHVLRRIDSPYVIRVFDVGETDRGQPYLVLEHADRGDLEQRMTQLWAGGYEATSEAILAVAHTLGNAMGAVHAESVVHRDLKPRNVLIRATSVGEHSDVAPVLDTDERLLIADLGFAKDLAASSGLTVAGGTTGFSAPEQASGGVVNVTADIYAASAILVWFVTGAAPDAEGRWKQTVKNASSASLADVLDTGLSPDPANRPATARKWLGTVQDTFAPLVAAAVPAPRRRYWPLAIAVAAAIVAAVLLWPSGDRVVDLGSGDVRVERLVGDFVATIEGPTEVSAGETARFVTNTNDYVAWTWVGPDGRTHPGTGAIDVVTRGPGTAVVRLTATFSSGETATIEHRFDVLP